jgi:hypothetical protein
MESVVDEGVGRLGSVEAKRNDCLYSCLADKGTKGSCEPLNKDDCPLLLYG